jgi:hypothetical protein
MRVTQWKPVRGAAGKLKERPETSAVPFYGGNKSRFAFSEVDLLLQQN